jgi:hypothetical protein
MNRTIFITFDLNALIWLDAWNPELMGNDPSTLGKLAELVHQVYQIRSVQRITHCMGAHFSLQSEIVRSLVASNAG